VGLAAMYREYFCYQQLSIEIDVIHVGKKEEKRNNQIIREDDFLQD
jgi:hypothetical protein